MNNLAPVFRDQRKIDSDHLNLLSIFHFVGAGFAVLGISSSSAIPCGSMRHKRIIFAFACFVVLLVYGYRHRPDATFRKRLVGTWRYSRTESGSTLEPLPSDLTFTISAN